MSLKTIFNQHVPAIIAPQLAILAEMVPAYLEAVAFTDFGEDEQPPSDSEFAPEAVFEAFEVCSEFLKNNRDLLEQAHDNHDYSFRQAGHDLWLTRNGHGAGFWDRGLDTEINQKELGELLSDACKTLGSRSVYLNEDDNLVYFDLG